MNGLNGSNLKVGSRESRRRFIYASRAAMAIHLSTRVLRIFNVPISSHVVLSLVSLMADDSEAYVIRNQRLIVATLFVRHRECDIAYNSAV